MKKIFMTFIIFLLILFSYNLNCFAQNSAIYFNVGGIINGLINFGYQYYLSENLNLRGSIGFITTSYGSAVIFIIGSQYFFNQFSGFFIGIDLGFGSISDDYYHVSVSLFKIFGGYRFLFNQFFIDPGITIGSVSLDSSGISAIGIILELGFLF